VNIAPDPLPAPLPLPLDVHILMYHHVLPEGHADSLRPFVVFKESFNDQLRFLRDSGFRSKHLTELFDQAEGRSSIADRNIAITFDDGSVSVFEYAFPLLVQYGFTATFFISPGLLGAANHWDVPEMPRVPLMGKTQVHELVKAGFEIGSHGVNHINHSKCSPAAAEKEMADSRKQIQDLFRVQCDFFSHPFGEYPANYPALCAEAGYRGAVGMTSPAKYAVEDRYATRRVLIHTGDNIRRFRLKMTSIYLRILSLRERYWYKSS
jgi:peptidoglycan/xylan/chitin deacetylase (PgdA/CDA1 family)